MDIVKQKLLEDFKKSNKERKEKLAKKYGFNNSQEYLAYLEKGESFPKPNIQKVNPKEKPTIHNVVLLDATGSMVGSKYDNAKIGITKELDWLITQTDVNYTATVQEFIHQDYSQDVKTKTHGLLVPPKNLALHFNGANGNNTPLYKAVLDIISQIKCKTDSSEKVLLKVYTDGDNNRLDHFQSSCKDKIKEVQSQNFTVTFVGTKSDLRRIINDLGLEESNCLEIENSGAGFAEAFNASFIATQTYSQKVLKGEDVTTGFYKKLI